MSGASRQEASTLLRRAVADPKAEFRDGQWESIDALVADRARLLVVERTGWGKSLVYFMATRLLRNRGVGPTLLISPLLALMRNQIAAASRLGLRAETINSSNPEQWTDIHRRLRADDVDLLIVSPERLSDDDFRENALMPIAGRVGLFVVDEAHCISDWGHDFRPDYRRITRVLQALPRNLPALATTATANDRVVADIREQLGPDLQLVRGPLARESLRLQNIRLPGQAERMAWLAEHLGEIPGSGIIYALTVADAQRLAAWLQSRGIGAAAYYGSLENDKRVAREDQLLNNRIKAIVATSALGMGFDKPDLGFVIHFQRPGSVIHYYQQVGRAGRGVSDAYGILLGGDEDERIAEYFIASAFPPEAQTREVLDALNDADAGLSLSELEGRINLPGKQIEKVLKILAARTPAPIVRRNRKWYATPVVYHPDSEKIGKLARLRRREQARMREYMAGRTCLMEYLRSELDDEHASVCGRCANCAGLLLSESYSEELAEQAQVFLRRSERWIRPHDWWPGDALRAYRWRGPISETLKMQTGRALSVWMDEGWGGLVQKGKQVDGRFDDRLVEASASMIRERWRPHPAPAWVTCVPSANQPTLVPDFAARLAAALGLPFIDCVAKKRDSLPQKGRNNNYQQARNLAGVFGVDERLVRREPVLLVDDVVDSRWTMTVVAALLRTVGATVVHPFALAQTSTLD
ncbi:MAG: RecQ family ATP-dependent DNA helicase [Blastocatellales bacterium]|nr:RecQ family ATP-dependent DNA helicase [Blastocatellales bacterium]